MPVTQTRCLGVNVVNAIFNIVILLFLVASIEAFAEDKPVGKKKDSVSVDLRRIFLIKPRRFKGVNREDNLNDIEVREIVAATQTIYPGAVVTIDAVKSGCPCEDGASCDAQVWVVIYEPGKAQGLLLSRIENRWMVGPVQKWWLKYDQLRMGRQRYWRSPPVSRVGDIEAIQDKIYALRNQIPVCTNDGDEVPKSGRDSLG